MCVWAIGAELQAVDDAPGPLEVRLRREVLCRRTVPRILLRRQNHSHLERVSLSSQLLIIQNNKLLVLIIFVEGMANPKLIEMGNSERMGRSIDRSRVTSWEYPTARGAPMEGSLCPPVMIRPSRWEAEGDSGNVLVEQVASYGLWLVGVLESDIVQS